MGKSGYIKSDLDSGICKTRVTLTRFSVPLIPNTQALYRDDGTGIPVVKAETEGRAGKNEERTHAGGQTGLRVHANQVR